MIHSSDEARAAGNRSDRSPSDGQDDGSVERQFIVIADRFAQFADGRQVLTVSDAVRLATSTPNGISTGAWTIRLGQGIEASDVEVLTALGGGDDNPALRLADSEPPLPPPVSAIVVHKTSPENVLLAGLKAESGSSCSADLRIHRDNELILDHPPGRHVPGMVIIEAMRQICTAQFEISYRPDRPDHDYVGVWQRLDLTFDGFLFPLRATVRFKITEADLGQKSRLRFRATTSIRQNGRAVASAVIDYSMVERERVAGQERLQGRQSTRAQLAGVLGPPEP